ncbi:right-handed parallel beta-helix repeat-containing protein [Gaoshiqia sp. Z1-71]|uniref:right-handed parallel beta-helix repeat-containing protein n=1 Tax=Gaoshiqia hydrogeniformans TaxID=3290090 RepID=UPI003BF84581
MNRSNLRTKAIALVTFVMLSGLVQSQRYPRAHDGVMLLDGTSFPFWNDETVYKKKYYVDQNHPAASDYNAGTEGSPFRTIGRAAREVQPGEKVLVKKGIYRESVRPVRGGDGPAAMIAYEAAPGGDVVISGSEVVRDKWVKSRTPYEPSMSFSHKLWMVSLPVYYFEESNPFRIQNANEYDMKVMRWAKDWTNRVPYTLVRGMVFQNGERMTQLCAYEDIVKLPGSYWVDTTRTEKSECTIHIHPFGGKDPNNQLMEVTTRQSPFNPKAKGVNYIRLNGFTIEQVGNGFPRSGKGALSNFGGSHWIIENNVFRKINSVAIEIGARTDEHFDEGSRETLEAVSGRNIVRNNTIYDCGTGGIQGMINFENLIEDNHIYNLGWQEAEFYYETAAIKILYTRNCLVRRNHIHDIEAAMGIWLDANNINSRVTQNLLYNVSCNFGGIFMEVSTRANLVDNNLVWNCGKHGIYQHDHDSLYVVHNLVGHSKENGIMTKITPGRRKDDRFTTAAHNKILYNVLVDNPRPFSYIDSLTTVSDYNLVASSESKDEKFNWESWQKAGFDKNSRIADISGKFNPSDLVFELEIKGAFPLVDRLPYITEDFLGRKYNTQHIFSGALKGGKNEVIQLSEYFKK